MSSSAFAVLAGMGMFAMLVMLVVGVLLAALVLSVAFRLVVGYMPSYLRALGAVVLTWIALAVVMAILGMVTSGSMGGLLSLVVQFLVGAAVINYLLLTQNGSKVGYGKACMVELVNMVIGIVLAVIIGGIMMLFFGSMLAHM